MLEINGLAGESTPNFARNPGCRSGIEAVQSELRAWAGRQPPAARAIADRIVGHLRAARIGARSNYYIKQMLVEEVERLRAATFNEEGLCR